MCTSCALPKFDQTKSDAFTERFVGILNGAALSMMISIGHRTGLFDTMSELGPAPAGRIAEAGGLHERYVREWLGAMTTGRVVEHDAEEGTYGLPAEHAAWLTRSATPHNLAVSAQFIGVLGSVESDVADCFREGGGVPYERFGRFNEVMADESGQTVVAALEEHILPLVPGLADRLAAGVDVVDVGCGRGRAILELAERYPASRFVGLDLLPDNVDWANAQARARGLTNIEFRRQDLTVWSEPGAYDVAFAFDAIHDQKDPAHLLSAVRKALRPGGVFLAQDIAGSSAHAGNMDHPIAPFIYTISCMHCMTVSLAQGGAGLGAAWGQELAERMFAEAGFVSTEVHALVHDIMNVFYVSTID